MTTDSNSTPEGVACSIGEGVDLSGIEVVELTPEVSPVDYQAAMKIANVEAKQRMDEPMLISWYDRDRDFESPQHSSECHLDSAIPGYVDYGLSHGAKLMIGIERGRFVFFYIPVGM